MNEILSPAGSLEAFYLAIKGGANAIYLGLDKFNARIYANNFNLDNLKELVDFAHLRNVKIYVTMNTILYDDELNEAFKTVDELAKINVDAIIVQDLALFHYVTNNYFSIKAHVSTQMGIDDYYASKLIKELGASRIVFARETNLETVKEIKEKLNIEVEAFIHGALCVSYSGNCLLSSFIGKRSGNRGRCAQPCRQSYVLLDKTNNKIIKKGYLLSMKDLSIKDNINDFKFIDSLKIEGRMKDPLYVHAITKYYRYKFDNLKINNDYINKVFNRTYTKGFINHENSSNITNIERPNNYGYLIGKIVKINNNKIWIKLFEELNLQDQIRIDSKNYNDEISLAVTKMFDANFKLIDSSNKLVILIINEKYKNIIKVGDDVYKTKDFKFLNLLKEESRNKEYQRIKLDFDLFAHQDQNLKLVVNYNNELKIEVISDYLVEKSLSSSSDYSEIFIQLSKLNDTPYYLDKLNLYKDKDIFIPKKILNDLRRKAIIKLNSKRLEFNLIKKEPSKIKIKNNSFKKSELVVEVSSLEQFNLVKELGIKHIYYQNKISRNHNLNYPKVNGEILVGGIGAISYYQNKNNYLISDYSLNASNYLDVAILSSLGISRITLSLELDHNSINELIDNYYQEFNIYPNLEMIIYGKLPLMHSLYCPLKRLNMCPSCKKNKYALKDKYQEFDLAFNPDCTIKILNSKYLNLIDEINVNDKISTYRLIFTDENNDKIKEIILKAQNKLNLIDDNNYFDNEINTRGHFKKRPL